MIRADIETEVSPIVGSEKQSEDMVNYLLQEFEGDAGARSGSPTFSAAPSTSWSTRTWHSKLKRMPEEARQKLQETLETHHQRGQSGGLICIIL